MYYKQKVARVLCPLSQVFVPLENETTGQAGAQTQFLSRTLPWKAA